MSFKYKIDVIPKAYNVLIELVSDSLSKLDYVDLLLLIGSVPAGVSIKGSDIDFAVLLNSKDSEEKLSKVLSEFLESFKDKGYTYYSYIIKGRLRRKKIIVSFHVYFTSNEKACLTNLFANKESFLKNEIVARRYSEAVFIDKVKSHELLFDWIKDKINVSNYPESIRDALVRENLMCLKWAFKVLESRDIRYLVKFRHFSIKSPHQFMPWCNLMLKVVYQAIYAINRVYFLPVGSKRVHTDIKKLMPRIDKEINYIVEQGNSRRQIQKKMQLFNIIFNKLSAAVPENVRPGEVDEKKDWGLVSEWIKKVNQ